MKTICFECKKEFENMLGNVICLDCIKLKYKDVIEEVNQIATSD